MNRAKRPNYTRGVQIRRILKFYWALQSPRSATEISKITGMQARQVYRWMNVAEEEGIVVAVGRNPKKFQILSPQEIDSRICDSSNTGTKK